MPKKNKKSNNLKPVVTLFEKINKDILMRVISSDQLTPEEKNTLLRYKQHMCNGFVPVNYLFSKNAGNFGRLYAENSLSLQNFKKSIRHALAKDIYLDIDMVNAHPVLLSQYCDKKNINCKILKDYVDNRDKWLEEIMSFHNCSHDCAKKLVLKLCYLGNYEIDVEGLNQCCICHQFCHTDIIHKAHVCQSCYSKADDFSRNYEHSYSLKESFILLYEKYWNVDIDINTRLDALEDIISDVYPSHSDKLDKLVLFSKELKSVAKLVYNIEKDIAEIVDNDTTKTNKYSSVLSLTVQVLEHKCLMSMRDFFESKWFFIGVLCFDGLMIEKKEKMHCDDDLLKKCSDYVKKNTGYNISLVFKPMDQGLKIPNFSCFVNDDKGAQEQLFRLEDPNYFKYCDKKLHIFDETTGQYTTDRVVLDYYITKHANFLLKEERKSKDFSEIKSYGRDDSLISNVYIFVKIAARDEEWLERTADTSLGYILFKNGIYNMKTGTFTKGFDPNIVFHDRVPHEFPERNKKDIKYAANMSFNLMLDDPKPLIVAFARALAGDIHAKKFYFGPGVTNAGKSKLIDMFISCFGGFIKNFNAECLACAAKNDTHDEGSRNRWAYMVRFARILFSNEIKMDKKLDGRVDIRFP